MAGHPLGPNKVLTKIKAIVPWLGLVAVYVFLIFFVAMKCDQLLNSDMSSELLLAKQIAEEGNLLSPNFYYSTELRIFNVQIIFAFLFAFFQDWVTVRIVGTATLCLVLLVSLFYFCSSVGLKKQFPLLGIVALVPISVEYARFVLIGLYYIPYLVLALLILGAFFRLRLNGLDRRNVAHTALLFLLSFLYGLQGTRGILVLFLPLLVASLVSMLITGWQDRISKKALILSMSVCVIAGVGFLINSLCLSTLYSFKDYSILTWTGFTFSAVELFIQYCFELFGFVAGASLLTAEGIVNVAVFCLLCAGIYSTVRLVEQYEPDSTVGFFTTWFISGFFLLLFASVFFDLHFNPRYLIPVLFFLLPVIALALGRRELGETKELLRRILLAVCVIGLTAQGILTYLTISTWDITQEQKKVTEYLVEKGLDQGYASYWNANVLTELSDGELDVFVWGASGDDNADSFDSLQQRFQWNQSKAHDEEIGAPNYFFLFKRNELYAESGLGPYLRTHAKPSYDSNEYVIYEYADIKQLLDACDLDQNKQ